MGDSEKVYEMLWDCEYCGTKKLLGKSQRFCASCGSSQNPDKRYFPSDEEKVEVTGYEFVGADKHCPSCDSAMSAKVEFCTNCGSPMDGSKKVELAHEREAREAAELAAANLENSSKKGGWLKWVLIGLGVVVLFAVVAIFWEKEIEVKVANHTWQTTIAIEKYKTVSESDWCDQTPNDARVYRRSREVRSHKEVADGQDCRMVKKDRGDGTFSESRQCTTKYRKEPVYGQKCYYKAERWRTHRTARANGGLNDTIRWPKTKIKRKGNCLGCERQGERKRTLTVHFQGPEELHKCTYANEGKWRSFKTGATLNANVGVMTNKLDCDL